MEDRGRPVRRTLRKKALPQRPRGRREKEKLYRQGREGDRLKKASNQEGEDNPKGDKRGCWSRFGAAFFAMKVRAQGAELILLLIGSDPIQFLS